LEKKSGDERTVEPGTIYKIPSMESSLSASISLRPHKKFRRGGQGFTDDFEPTWLGDYWTVSARDAEGFHPLVDADGEAVMMRAESKKKSLTNVFKLASWPDSNSSTCLHLSKPLQWDFTLQYLIQQLEGDPLVLNGIAADKAGDTVQETLYSHNERAISRAGLWTTVKIEYLKYWDGKQWAAELRRYVDGDYQSTIRIKMERPEVRFELGSGACLRAGRVSWTTDLQF
jgi:hypothetical protein